MSFWRRLFGAGEQHAGAPAPAGRRPRDLMATRIARRARRRGGASDDGVALAGAVCLAATHEAAAPCDHAGGGANAFGEDAP